MRNIQIPLLLLMLGWLTASAQLVSIGIKGGIPITDPLTSQNESPRYLVGASIEIRLPANFAIEADAIYRRIGDTTAFGGYLQQGLVTAPLSTSFINRQRGNSYEFPIVGKYYLKHSESNWRPFIESGYAFRVIQFSSDYSQTTIDTSGLRTTSSSHSNYGSGLGVGAVFGAGVRLNTGRFAFVPEFRYTRWGGFDTNSIRKNEAGVLLGITF